MPADAASAPDQRRDGPAQPLEFLVVDEFLRTVVDARALKTAFELGLVDRLVEHRSGSVQALGRTLGTEPQGLRFLLDLLAANGVIEERSGDVRLAARFLTALRYRDLLEAKLDFAGFLLNDFADLFTMLVKDAGGFAAKARLFQLFDYRRALDPRIENYVPTRAWMRFTSALTRYEARACMQLHDFAGHRRVLDVGGNSGEFVLQLLRCHSGLRGTVLDLPLVCEIGMEHVLGEPELPRIGFLKADVRTDPLPGGYDLITFKSMLHDWPWDEAKGYLGKAAQALDPGGTLLVFERGPLRVREHTPPFSLLPILLFFRSYRPAADYVAQMQALGLQQIEVREIELDAPFYLVSGRKAAS
ncbi:MAG TPA: methyltransferase [Solirubrobacteraceae bacterium]|nr:methyltransferase [Solirubrobacteraceae bacterium]